MRVLCVKIINPVTRKEVIDHPGVRLDQEYEVLSILVEPGRGAKFRILSADRTPVLFDAAMFVTSSDNIPSNWVVRTREGGVVEFAPGAWLEPGFWERYFDRDRAAVDIFDAEKNTILERER